MHPTHNTLSENIGAQSVELLNKHLAASIDLRVQVKQAHWNVRGPSFITVHELCDTVATDLFTEVSRGIDQQLWLVESHLPPAPARPDAVAR